MPGRQAKIVSASALRRMLSLVGKRTTRKRDRVIVLLSVKAGLRACEIARLDWSMVLDAHGKIAPAMNVQDSISKKRSGRRVPVHPELRRALIALRGRGAQQGPVIVSARGGALKPNSIVNWFVALYANLGFDGCSSHSGRRTFITNAARNAHRTGCSLRDVQLLAGHKSIAVTQGYIEGDTRGQHKLVAFL